MTPDQIKHLEFIQSVITRMNTNSFQLKGWSITLVSALLALFASTKNMNFILVAIFPALVFWFLDAYYLMQERKFRGLYSDIAGLSNTPKETRPYAMRPDLYCGGKYSFGSSFISPTISGLYLSVIIGLIALYFYLQCYTTKGEI